PKTGEERGNGRRHGYLRGWVKTNEDGRYRIDTIRPGSYPGRNVAAHVHMTVLPPGGDEYRIADTVFEDDPNVDDAYRRRARTSGGSGIIALEKAGGIWRGTRDITLK
ncbi:MAG: intradiol ring-cleavage dioxygenase, partial [Thermoanaerobaculia bacterium]|nr:intradiol ring-cleavage dioxygenase [Thermoanaerobaculia bacterium]